MARRLAVLTALSLVVVSSGASPASAVFPGQNGKIAFTGLTEENPGVFTPDVYTFNPNGSGFVRLTNRPGNDRGPKWSPDGSKIAFISDRSGTRQVHMMNADGSNVEQLTSGPETGSSAPAWSPDGSRIAFARSVASGNNDIFIANSDGTNAVNVTNNPRDEKSPDWSPRGDEIAFLRSEPQDHIWKLDVGTFQATQLTNDNLDSPPRWSPDAERIVFHRAQSGHYHVFAMDADGGNAAPLVSPSDDETSLTSSTWSPDGRNLAYKRQHCCFIDDLEIIALQTMSSIAVFEPPPPPLYMQDLDWQAVPFEGFPRPKAAPSINVTLVPAYRSCSSPNRQHGPPLDSPSCSPPAPASTSVTTSAPSGSDNANLVGNIKLRAKPGSPGLPEDSDVLVQGTVSDVRCLSGTATCGNPNMVGASDYVGELLAETEVRWTDRLNGISASGGSEAGTVADVSLGFPLTCTNTASTAEGGRCTTSSTSLNAVIPGAVKDGKRTVIEHGHVTVFDGGPDGDVDTEPDAAFLRQGVFVP